MDDFSGEGSISKNNQKESSNIELEDEDGAHRTTVIDLSSEDEQEKQMKHEDSYQLIQEMHSQTLVFV